MVNEFRNAPVSCTGIYRLRCYLKINFFNPKFQSLLPSFGII